MGENGSDPHRCGERMDVTAGISPQFWSHVPMTVMDVQRLKLLGGINYCYVDITKNGGIGQQHRHCLKPVSRCLLVGSIVYADLRRDGSMAYVLDDGTGLIDCVHWSMGFMQDIYHLPSLDDYSDDVSRSSFSVGDTVRVFGKIECVAVVRKNGANEDEIIREIQASLMERILDNPLRDEALHWRRCQKAATVDGPESYLDLLGSQIQSQVKCRIDLPAVDDTNGSWRVFGTSCRCNLQYMDKLLYCHCQAKIEPSDPNNRFRDELLHKLLAMEASCSGNLTFTYKDIKNDVQLRELAAKELQTSLGSCTTLIDRLFLNTFRALRHDGILHLLNNHTDEYLLITRDRVLEPFVLTQLGDTSLTSQKMVPFTNFPPYLSRLHNDRLHFIKRCLIAETKGCKK